MYKTIWVYHYFVDLLLSKMPGFLGEQFYTVSYHFGFDKGDTTKYFLAMFYIFLCL